MLKNLCNSTRFYYDTRDCINPSLPPLKIRGGGWGYEGWQATPKAYKELLAGIFQHICPVNNGNMIQILLKNLFNLINYALQAGHSIFAHSPIWSKFHYSIWSEVSRYISGHYIESVHKLRFSVIPAEAGIQNPSNLLDSRLYGNDKQAVYKQTLFQVHYLG
jgi:hypothetical protein